MEILWWKIIVLSSLFVACLTASLLPLKFVSSAIKGGVAERRQRLVERSLRLLNCFGGGVFLATCLLDLLPDVQRKFALVLKALDIHTNFAVAEFVTAVGLFFILTVEQIAYDCKERSAKRHSDKAVEYGSIKNDGRVHLKDSLNQETVNSDSETSPLLQHSQAPSNLSSSLQGQGCTATSEDVNAIDTESPSLSRGHTHGTLSVGASERPLIQHTGSHDMVTSSSLRSLLLLLALSLHSLFEGLAVGLQSSTDQLLGIFAAILIHKVVLALSLGINFVQSSLRPSTIIQASICFASMAPVGIIIGIVVTEGYDTTAHNITSGILQGLATGTFLYITFFEVLPMEMSQAGDRLLKVLCTLLGFILIVGTLFLDPNTNNPQQP